MCARHRPLICLLLPSAWCAALAPAQQPHPLCGGEYHYRWLEKTDTTLAALPPVAVELDTIVQTWTTPLLPADDWCAPRTAKERRTYAVVGWVRVFRLEADSDWHVELTSTAAAPLVGCIIAEIPPVRYGAVFARARAQLARALLSSAVSGRGYVRPPVRLRIVGAAFYDAWHLTHGGHGDCNQQPGGLWELHPVFSVAAP
ncbi:MAG TPA: hypothetical protein VJN39_07140 [Gemmatimonadales bacterium]|nr:hypothetical protein [Gemmatimonadales bacterium]